MDASSKRWREVSPSRFEHERAGLDHVRAHLPDTAPFHAWSNLQFLALDGSVNEVDLLLIGPAGLFMVELKMWGGRVTGNGQAWRIENERRNRPNPLLLTNSKVQRLKSLLIKEAARVLGDRGRGLIPYFQAATFLHNPNVVSALDEVGRQWVYGLEGVRGNRLPLIVTDLLAKPAADPSKALDASRSNQLANLLDGLGFLPSTANLTVGSVQIEDPEPHAEGARWQEYLGHNISSTSLRRRVRIFRPSRGASAEERKTVSRAAEREIHLMQGITHPSIAKPLDLYEHDSGTALIYEHEGEQQRFDLYLAERQDNLTIEQRLGLIRQLAETLQYAHTRHLYHRALCPKAIYVRNPDTNPQLVITDWQTGGRDSASLNGPASLLAGTSHLDYLVDVTNRSYQAPELVTDPSSTGPTVDVFSLGALGYTIMAGRPPASTQAELQELINRVGGLDLSEVVDVVDGELQFLVYAATFGAVSDRLADVKLFLARLDEVEHGLLAEAPEAVVDPLDAHRGDILDGLFRVERRLGRGSTAVALLVSRLDDPSADSVVLKVALDHEKDSRLDAEEEALRQLDDWRIVKLLDGPRYVGERRTLVLEYGGEDTLGQRLRHDRLHIDQLQRFGHDLLKIAAHLDTKGTWHRDIKPDNLGIRPNRSDRKPHLVLYDFSMARISATDIHAGTPPYLDPFLGIARSRYDDAAERFAVAVTLYEMAVGTRPIWGDDASNPSAVDVEVAVDSERIDVGVRTPLTEFFRKALARQAKQRYATVEEMARAWKAAFDSVEPARVGGSTPVVGLTLNTVLSETGLTRRALAAAERFGATTVRELLAIPPMELARGQGVNQATKSELTRVAKQWRAVFFGPEADASNEPDVEVVLGKLGIDATLSGLLTETKIRNKIDQRALSLLLGLPDESGAPLEWPDTKQVAALLGTGTSAGQVQRVRLKAVRNTWPESPLLDMVRDDVIKLLDVNGGVMTGGELATALLSAMGSHADEPVRSSQAVGLVRAVVETELERGGDALLDYARHADVVLVGRERDDPWGLAATKRLEYGHALGAVAADLAAADPLLPPAGAVRQLREEPVPDGMDVLDEARLVQLAAAAGGAAVTSTGQIYPRGLDAGRALVLAQAAVGIGQAGITPRQLSERVSARFPEAQPLPDRPELDRVLRDAGLPLVWAEDRYKPREDLVSLLRSATRYSSRLATVPAGSPQALALQDVDRRIGEALTEGRLLTTNVPARLLDAARQSLIEVFGLHEIDVTEFCLRALHRLADENEIEDWTVVLRADAADRSSTDWNLLLQLVSMALDELPAELTAAPGPVLLTEAAPLVRYGWLGRLESWITDGTVPRPGVLLVPADDRAATPMLDGKPVPVNSTTQWLTLPTAWLNARNRRAS